MRRSFGEILQDKYLDSRFSTTRKCYVVCRRDLTYVADIYPAVQGAHALAKLQAEQRTDGWEYDNHLIFLGVEDLDELRVYMKMLDDRGIKYSEFVEPDLNYQITAFAVVAHDYLFKKVGLL